MQKLIFLFFNFLKIILYFYSLRCYVLFFENFYFCSTIIPLKRFPCKDIENDYIAKPQNYVVVPFIQRGTASLNFLCVFAIRGSLFAGKIKCS